MDPDPDLYLCDKLIRIRIREALKHVDLVDPDSDPEHCFFLLSTTWSCTIKQRLHFDHRKTTLFPLDISRVCRVIITWIPRDVHVVCAQSPMLLPHKTGTCFLPRDHDFFNIWSLRFKPCDHHVLKNVITTFSPCDNHGRRPLFCYVIIIKQVIKRWIVRVRQWFLSCDHCMIDIANITWSPNGFASGRGYCTNLSCTIF